MKYWIALLSLLAAYVPAQAKWYEASSDHFVIYAEDSERDLRKFAENLEQYHSAMEYVRDTNIPTPSPSNRLVIFVAGNQKAIRRLAGNKDRTIGGFYTPRAGASRAFVQDIRLKKGYPSSSMIILLHEYAHHFLISSSRYAMPRWYSEGAAEFFAAASFNEDGSVRIGRPALHRANELAYADDVSVEELLDAELYDKNKGRGYDAFYGRSWLLTHYLTFSKERSGQLAAYMQMLMNGTNSLEAGRQAFGDLDKLQQDLDKYLERRRMLSLKLQPEMIQFGQVTIRELTEGEAEMMPVRMKSQRGVTREEAVELLEEAQEIAAEYPNDAAVLTALAKAEYDAGNDDAAIIAADKAIAINPSSTNAYVQKGYALFRKAEDADDPDAAYRAAMVPFTKLNALENDHPLPLIYYYRSFTERGTSPDETARHALERAAQLAPFDQGLAMKTAMMLAKEGKISLAIQKLHPLAGNPHSNRLSKIAQGYIALLKSEEEGTPWLPPPPIRIVPSQASPETEEGGE